MRTLQSLKYTYKRKRKLEVAVCCVIKPFPARKRFYSNIVHKSRPTLTFSTFIFSGRLVADPSPIGYYVVY